MKTPRQILFERHRSAEPKLEAVRQKALASLAQPSKPESSQEKNSSALLASLHGFLRAFRWHLAGMSAAWLLTALLNMEASPATAPSIAKQDRPSPRQLLMALRENRRQLLELIDPTAFSPSLAPPPFVPPRRSELRTFTALA